jgi:hypothetical protein
MKDRGIDALINDSVRLSLLPFFSFLIFKLTLSCSGIDWSARRHVPHLGSLHRRYPLCRLRISLPPLYVFSPSLTPLQSSRSNSPLSSSLISSYA